MRRREDLRLLVFDWDGTLLDSIGRIVACALRAFEEVGLPEVPEARIRAGIGLGYREMLEEIVPGLDDAMYLEIRRTASRVWWEIQNERPALFPGAADTLRQLAAGGYLLAVATGKGRRGLSEDMASSGVTDLFAVTRTVDESPGKPHPGMLLEILEETGSRAGETLMVGDSVHDLNMARAAGVPVVGVSSGSESRSALLAAGAADCLDNVNGLPRWLEGCRPAGEEGEKDVRR